jgi:hypothetical protein
MASFLDFLNPSGVLGLPPTPTQGPSEWDQPYLGQVRLYRRRPGEQDPQTYVPPAALNAGAAPIAYPPASDATGLPASLMPGSFSPAMTSAVNAAPRAPDLPPPQAIGRANIGPVPPVPTQQAAVPPVQNAQAPQQQGATSPGLSLPDNFNPLNNIAAALFNLTGSGTSPANALLNAGAGLLTGKRMDREYQSQQLADATYRALVPLVGKDQALLAATNPKVLEQVTGNLYAKPQFEKAGPGETPYLIGPTVGGGGRPTVTPLAPGMSVQEEARQKALGTAQASQQMSLPNTLNAIDQMTKTIDDVQNHPGKNLATGWLLGQLPFGIGPQATDFIAKAKQLQGQAFIQMYDRLRGAGAITEAEGVKGTQALTNLQRAQTTEQFDQALNQLRDVLKTSRQTAIDKANTNLAPTPAPQSGGWTQIAPNVRIRERQ